MLGWVKGAEAAEGEAVICKGDPAVHALHASVSVHDSAVSAPPERSIAAVQQQNIDSQGLSIRSYVTAHKWKSIHELIQLLQWIK